MDSPKCKRYFQPHVLVSRGWHISEIVASSVWLNNPDVWGEHFAIDGIYSTTNGNLFRSSRQDHPWLQWHFGETTTVKAVRIRNRVDCCGNELRNIEIRVVEDQGNKQITCGNIQSPGKENQQYDVRCQNPQPQGNFIVIQRNQLNVVLQINELILNPPAPGKKQLKVS